MNLPVLDCSAQLHLSIFLHHKRETTTYCAFRLYDELPGLWCLSSPPPYTPIGYNFHLSPFWKVPLWPTETVYCALSIRVLTGVRQGMHDSVRCAWLFEVTIPPLYEKALQLVADGLYMLLLWGCTACPSLSLSCSESAFRTIILECLDPPPPLPPFWINFFSLIIISRMDSLLKHTERRIENHSVALSETNRF